MSDQKRKRYYTDVGTVSMTRQEFVDDCDISNILSKYASTGMITHANTKLPSYDDVADVVTYQEALNITIKAQEAFMTLPSKIRSQFENDPGLFLDFANDPANGKKLVEMGLAQTVRLPDEADSSTGSIPEPAPPKPPGKRRTDKPDPLPDE